METVFLLAQAATDTAAAGWDAKVLGPLGALVITLTVLVVYARHTERSRIPTLSGLLKEAAAEAKRAEKEHDKEVADLRRGYQARENALRKKLDAWKGRHSREQGRRIFFQNEAINLAKRHDEEPPKIPTELSRTSFSHRPLPRDPDPDDFHDDIEIPPAP